VDGRNKKAEECSFSPPLSLLFTQGGEGSRVKQRDFSPFFLEEVGSLVVVDTSFSFFPGQKRALMAVVCRTGKNPPSLLFRAWDKRKLGPCPPFFSFFPLLTGAEEIRALLFFPPPLLFSSSGNWAGLRFFFRFSSFFFFFSFLPVGGCPARGSKHRDFFLLFRPPLFLFSPGVGNYWVGGCGDTLAVFPPPSLGGIIIRR